MDGSRRLDQHKSSKKKARELHKLEKKTSKIDKTQEKSIGATSEPNFLDVLRRSPEEISERSHLSDLPHEQLEELIEAKKEEKKSFESAYSELLAHITTARQELKKILENKNLSRKALVNKQLQFIKDHQYLNDLMAEDINKLKEEKNFLDKEKLTIENFKNKYNVFENFMQFFTKSVESLFQHCGQDVSFILVTREPSRLLSIAHYYNKCQSLSCLVSYLEGAAMIHSMQKVTDFFNHPTIKEVTEIADAKAKVALWNERTEIIQHARDQFENVNFEDEIATREAYSKTREDCIATDKGSAALDILNTAYDERLKHKTNPDKKDTLKNFDKAWEEEQQKENIQEDRQKYLKKCTEYSEDKMQRIIEEGSEMSEKFFDTFVKDLDQRCQYYLIKSAVSFYDFVEKNITHRLSNSLDDLEKKNRGELSRLEGEIEELEWLRSQRQSEQPDQSPMSMEKQPSTDKLQNNLETAFKDADKTPECRAIVLSYLSGLFKKFHPQSSNDATAIKTFFEKNINEAEQIGKYLEQNHFIRHKIRDDAIQFAIHLKHAFGFPLHQASIDKDFNIVRSRSSNSKEGSSSISRLDIDRQGRILKDGRVQRVYLIGFQDASEASSSHADAKPMALLAMQSTETGYPKYGAGTPLPTGGVVDVVTAQHTTPDQPNLYKATLAIETLQETHEQKDVDLQTLELFEAETVMNPHTKTSLLYDITTFTGKVKDKPPQALPEHSKPEEAYQETTGPCIVDLNQLLSTVRNVIEDRGRFCPLWRAMMYIKRQIAEQALGQDKVPTSDQGWQTNGAIHWADFHEYSTSMNMFAKYLVLAYREELGLSPA